MRDTMVPLDGKSQELSPEAIRITSVSPPSSTMLMGRQPPETKTATALVTFSRTGLVNFLEKSWSVGWRPSNLGLLCIKVITSRRAASVMAKFSLTNATYNFSFVDCSIILGVQQRLSAQQSLSSFHLQLPQWFSNFFCHSPL